MLRHHRGTTTTAFSGSYGGDDRMVERKRLGCEGPKILHTNWTGRGGETASGSYLPRKNSVL